MLKDDLLTFSIRINKKNILDKYYCLSFDFFAVITVEL